MDSAPRKRPPRLRRAGEAIDDGRYPDLTVDEHGVKERDDQQLLNQAEEQAIEVVFPEKLRRSQAKSSRART